MGCSHSEPVAKAKTKEKKPLTFGKKANLNIADFMFCRQLNGVCVRAAGSISGQQFIVEDNADCEIYLLDSIAAMNVDSCRNCAIVTGPVAGSIFLRDCSDCVIVTMCQQLRLRNCHNLSKSIYI